MQIHGLNKTTLLDYPGRVASTIFTGGCNFRCPFCHNAGLVLNPDGEPVIPEEEVLAHLRKRQGILEGVCITGGEPCIQSDLREFIEKIRALNYPIKLDTNGYRPDILKSLVNDGLIDYVAMDIKSSPSGYAEAAGLDALDMDRIRESVHFLMDGPVEYEFRTTVVKELHAKEDFLEIGKWLSGCRAYYLQAYVDSGNTIESGYSAYDKDEMEGFRDLLIPFISEVGIRGMD